MSEDDIQAGGPGLSFEESVAAYPESAAKALQEMAAQLRASEAECERLRREVEDVRKLDEWADKHPLRDHTAPRLVDGHYACSLHEWHGYVYPPITGQTRAAARHAAVEYLEKERKDG